MNLFPLNECIKIIFSIFPFSEIYYLLKYINVNENISNILNDNLTELNIQYFLINYPNCFSNILLFLKDKFKYKNLFKKYIPKYLKNSSQLISYLFESNKLFDFTNNSFFESFKIFLFSNNKIKGIKLLISILNENKYILENFNFQNIFDEYVLKQIQLIQINSIHKEIKSRLIFSLLKKIPISQDFLEKIEFFSTILSLSTYHKYKISYSFEFYPNINFLNLFLNLLFSLEYDQYALQFASLHDLNFFESATNRLKISLFLGITESARFWAQFSKVTENLLISNLAFGLGPTDTFVNDLIRIPIEKLHRTSSYIFNFYNNVKLLVQFKPKQSQNRIDDLQSFISYYIQPPSVTINILCKYGFIETAFVILCSLHQTNDFLKSFIFDFTFPILSKGKTSELIHFLYSHDPGLSFITPLLTGLIDFYRSRKMYRSLYLILTSMNWLETAAEIAIECYNDSNNNRIKKNMSMHAEELLTQSLAIRKGQIESSPDTFPYYPSNLTEIELKKLLLRISYHNQIYSLSEKNKINEILNELNFILNENNIPKISALLIIYGYFDLSAKILDIYEINLSITINEVIKYICLKGLDEIERFLTISLKKKIIFDITFNSLLKYMIMSNQWFYIPSIISKFIPDVETQCLLFIEYGFLGESIEISLRKRFFKYLPLIGNLASQRGNSSLAEFIMEKLLN